MSYIAEMRALVGSRPLLIPGGRAILEDNDKRVLFHRRSDLGIWDLPGGGAEIGESMAECVVRETYEETGLTAQRFEPIGLASHPEAERVTYPNGDVIQGIGLILWITQWSGSLRTSPESTELRFMDPTDLTDLRPNIAATVAAFGAFKRTGEFQLF